MAVSEVFWRFKGGEDDQHKYPRLGEYGD
jgi:hypothetical protein